MNDDLFQFSLMAFSMFLVVINPVAVSPVRRGNSEFDGSPRAGSFVVKLQEHFDDQVGLKRKPRAPKFTI